MTTSQLLNVGCGQTFHPAWVNVDMKSSSLHVIEHDLTRGLPFPDKTFGVCYSSHVLEHLEREEAGLFLREQKRVLQDGGIVRVVVPDLEQICRNYLAFLAELLAGNRGAEFKYDYTLLELFDQVVRDETGGELLRLWYTGKIADPDFVRSRSGIEAEGILSPQPRRAPAAPLKKNAPLRRIGRQIATGWMRARLRMAEAFVAILLGARGTGALRVGLFRRSGEVHRVMYDRFSLTRLLRAQGFRDVRFVSATKSQIPNFDQYGLDAVEGVTRKPDSIFVEATRGD